MGLLTTSSLWAALPLVGLATLAAMSGPILVRRWVKLEQLRTNNEVAGFKFATVGVLYAVLLAFAVIVVWEKFNDADGEVAVEAGAAVTIYRLAEGMGGAPGAALHEAITAYLRVRHRRRLAGDGARARRARRRPRRSTRSMPSSCASSRRTSAPRW